MIASCLTVDSFDSITDSAQPRAHRTRLCRREKLKDMFLFEILNKLPKLLIEEYKLSVRKTEK